MTMDLRKAKPRQYAKDRDAAFMAFVQDGDYKHIDAMTQKYNIMAIPHTDTGAAGVYKAVQHCVGIPTSVKNKAVERCIALGFVPWIGAER